MTDRTPPDSLPPEDSAEDRDPRSDIEQAVECRDDDVERAGGGDDNSPLEPTVSVDTAGGAGGVVRNQDEDAQ